MQDQNEIFEILRQYETRCDNSSLIACTVWKVSKYGVFSGPYFPVFGLNAEIYGVNLPIQSKYGKIRTRKNSVFGHFSRSDD